MNSPPAIRLFVYGSLKRGGEYHARFCQGVLAVTPATVTGRLFQHPSGYPMLVVPNEHVLAKGTNDMVTDTQTWAQWSGGARAPLTPPGDSDWDAVRGELLTFNDPLQRLRDLDRLEDFRPGDRSLYERVIVATQPTDAASASASAWCYIAPGGVPPPGSQRIGPQWE